MEMKTYKIGDLYTVSNGLSKGKAFFGQGYPFLTFSEVMNNFFVPETLQSLVQTEVKERAKFSIQRGDIFLNRTSETADELGISCVALKNYPNATFNGFCKRLRPITEDVVPEYIGYYLRTNAFRKHMSALTGSMITRASLRNERLLSIEVKLPSKEIQLKIANILRQYDMLIDNCKAQITLLEEAAQRLYREWFIDMRFPGHETTTFGENGLPEGWERKPIASVCNRIASGSTPSRKHVSYWENASIKWFKTKELLDGWLMDSEEHISEEAEQSTSVKLFPANTILMAIYASPTLGRLGILSQQATFNQAALGFVVNEDEMTIEYLFCKLRELREEFNNVARGAGQQNISGEIVKQWEITIPAKSVIDSFTALCKPYFKQWQNISLIQNRLIEYRDLLLPRLISGQIEINA